MVAWDCDSSLPHDDWSRFDSETEQHAEGFAQPVRDPQVLGLAGNRRQSRSGALPSDSENVMRNIVVFVLLAGLSNLAAADTVYYIDMVNTAPSSITSLAMAMPGTNRFQSVLPGETPLRGGGESVTVAIRKGDEGCLRDLRVGFADGRILVHPNFNICRNVSYHSGRYLHLRPQNSVATAP